MIRYGEKNLKNEVGNNDNIVINQTFVAKLGFDSPEEAVGQVLYMEEDGENKEKYIIAICDDFYLSSINETISPLIISMDHSSANYIVFSGSKGVKNFEIEKDLEFLGMNKIGKNYSISNAFEKFYENDFKIISLLFVSASICVIFVVVNAVSTGALEAFRLRKTMAIMESVGGDILSNVEFFLKKTMSPVLIGMIFSGSLGFYLLKLWLDGFHVIYIQAYYFPALFVVMFFCVALICMISCFLMISRNGLIKHLIEE